MNARMVAMEGVNSIVTIHKVDIVAGK